MKNRILHLGLILLVVSLQSCLSLKQYNRPEEKVLNDLHFRTDNFTTDSLNLAEFSWREIFLDTILQRYIQTALDSNIDIRQAYQTIEISDAYLRQAKVNVWPTLSTSPGVTYQTQSQNTQFGQIIGERVHNVQYNIPLQASWEIDVWGKLKAMRQVALDQYLQTVTAHQAITSSLVANVALSYYQLLMLDKQREILQETIEFRRKYVESSRSLKDAGSLTAVAVKQAEAQLLNAESLLVSLDYQIELQENYLGLLMAQSPQSLKRSDLDATELTSHYETGFPVQLLQNRPDVRAAEYALKEAFDQTNVASTLFYPSLTITANTGLQSIDFTKLFNPASFFATLVGGLTQPILQGKQIRTNKEVALTRQEIAYLEYRKKVLQAIHEVSAALLAYDTQTKIVSLKNQEFEAYSQATVYSTELVNNGLGNYLEIILANERALNAKLDYLRAQFSQIQAQIQLYNALGGGWR